MQMLVVQERGHRGRGLEHQTKVVLSRHEGPSKPMFGSSRMQRLASGLIAYNGSLLHGTQQGKWGQCRVSTAGTRDGCLLCGRIKPIVSVFMVTAVGQLLQGIRCQVRGCLSRTSALCSTGTSPFTYPQPEPSPGTEGLWLICRMGTSPSLNSGTAWCDLHAHTRSQGSTMITVVRLDSSS